MPPSDAPRKPLAVPDVTAEHYKRNFIRLAVCELRFPTLLEFEQRAPLALSKALRKEFPTYETATNVSINPGNVAQVPFHQFHSRNRSWTVSLRASSLSLETSVYDTFDDFAARLGSVLVAASGSLDTDFFTRIGLRYVNSVPFKAGELEKWINPQLVGALAAETYGSVDEYWQRVRGPTSVGGYTFSHGISGPEYFLDLDFFSEDVAYKEAIPLVKRLHTSAFSLFRWAIADGAKAHLES